MIVKVEIDNAFARKEKKKKRRKRREKKRRPKKLESEATRSCFVNWIGAEERELDPEACQRGKTWASYFPIVKVQRHASWWQRDGAAIELLSPGASGDAGDDKCEGSAKASRSDACSTVPVHGRHYQHVQLFLLWSRSAYQLFTELTAMIKTKRITNDER